ncbi:MAG: hypothetical protein WBX25_32285, partial [Rhodomicrobium sp.]
PESGNHSLRCCVFTELRPEVGDAAYSSLGTVIEQVSSVSVQIGGARIKCVGGSFVVGAGAHDSIAVESLDAKPLDQPMHA